MSKKRALIVGGVAGGASAATPPTINALFLLINHSS